jgi:hypothetical protein
MKRLLLLLLLAAFIGSTATPILSSVVGLGPTAAYAGNDDSQGDNDNQGEDEQ